MQLMSVGAPPWCLTSSDLLCLDSTSGSFRGSPVLGRDILVAPTRQRIGCGGASIFPRLKATSRPRSLFQAPFQVPRRFGKRPGHTSNTNLLGLKRVTAALLKQFIAQRRGAIMNVFSALAMMPAVMMPSSCAGKAGHAPPVLSPCVTGSGIRLSPSSRSYRCGSRSRCRQTGA
jgi:hypothetical protein